jgi:hypothetical protein
MATASELEDLENAGYDSVHDWVWQVCHRQQNNTTPHAMALDWMIQILKNMHTKDLIDVLAEYVIEEEHMDFEDIERYS